MLSAEKIKLLQEITKKESTPEASIEKLIDDYIETKLAYWQIIDKVFTSKKGMKFEEYEDTKRDEWDGSDWEDAFIGIKYYQELKDKWILQTSR
jgi:hypothetical protein